LPAHGATMERDRGATRAVCALGRWHRIALRAWAGPRVPSPHEVQEPRVAVPGKDLASRGAPPTRRAVHEERRIARRQLTQTALELVERDEPRARDVAARVLLARAHVEHDERRIRLVEGEPLGGLDVTIRAAAEYGLAIRGLPCRQRREMETRHAERPHTLVPQVVDLAPADAQVAQLALDGTQAADEPPGHEGVYEREGAEQEGHPRRVRTWAVARGQVAAGTVDSPPSIVVCRAACAPSSFASPATRPF